MIRFLFFLSGAAALAYEVLWSKWLTRVIGVTTFSISTVVATFLTGLAIGGLLFGERIDRRGRPLRLYAFLEAGVAACALALYFLLPVLESAYVFLHRRIGGQGALILIARVALAFLALLPPTILMGGTLPVLCRREVWRGHSAPRALSALYALNTLGGVAGTLATGFFLIEHLGLRGTLFAAVLANLACAGIALLLDGREGAAGRPAQREARAAAGAGTSRRGERESERSALPNMRAVLLAASALSGFTALSFEIVWTRALGIFLRSGIVYSFSLALANFLLGIFLGSWIYHAFLARRRVGMLSLSILQTGLGATGLISVWSLARIGDLPEWVAGRMGGDYSWGEWAVVWLVASASVMLVPAILMGIVFPLIGGLLVRGESVGGDVGRLYALNGLGSVLGALASGFVLIPWLGTLESLRLNALLCLALALAAASMRSGRPSLRHAGTAALTAAGPALLVALASLAIPSQLIRQRITSSRPGTNLFYKEGAAGLVEVYDRIGVEGNHYRKLYDNGTSYAGSTQNGRRYHKLLGHLPALLHPSPSTGLVIGFGSGMTFGAMMLDPRIQRVDCVELSPEVLEASRFFAQDNGSATRNPKGRIVQGDGREHLLSTDERYDLISLEPPPPRFAGVVNLYSVDFYRLCRSRMRSGGIMAQWIPMHSHTVEEMRDLIRSFVQVFPEATFWVPNERDGILVGSASRWTVGAEDLRARMRAEPVASDLRSIDVPDLGALLGGLLMDAQALAAYTRQAGLITDDRPSIEYFASHGLIERWGHLEDVMRRSINPAKWMEAAGGGGPISFSAEEVDHLRAMQDLLIGVVAGDRGDIAGKKQAFAAALQLQPDSTFLRRLNIVTGTPEE
jgi:spermidine synthase